MSIKERCLMGLLFLINSLIWSSAGFITGNSIIYAFAKGVGVTALFVLAGLFCGYFAAKLVIYKLDHEVSGREPDQQRGIDKKYEQPDESEVLEHDENDTTFHIGQFGSKNPASTLVCKICKGKEFNIGTDAYYTAIKCVKCDWQICIHEG